MAVRSLVEEIAIRTAEEGWIAVLEDMEEDLARLRRCALDSEELFELPTGWNPPEDAGPLPESLGARARAVFAEMQELAVVLKGRRDETARQLRAVDAVPRATSSASLYIDVVG